jgi:hypothetical protein
MIDRNMTSFAQPRRWVLVACLWACLLASALTPAVALAQEEEVPRDARLEGYPQKVHLDNDSPALSYILLIVLGALALSVMFKNARRTHLD